MTISNNASGLRPGVCLSTDRPAAPYEGQLIYETDTDRILYWSGSSWKITGGQMPTIAIRAGANQTGIANGTWTFLTFPSHTIEANNAGFTYSSGLFTIPTGMSGFYSVFCQIQWDINNAGFRSVQLANSLSSNNGIISSSSLNVTSAAYARQSVSGTAELVAGQTYGFSVLQDSGSARATEIGFMTNRFVVSMITSI